MELWLELFKCRPQQVDQTSCRGQLVFFRSLPLFQSLDSIVVPSEWMLSWGVVFPDPLSLTESLLEAGEAFSLAAVGSLPVAQLR